MANHDEAVKEPDTWVAAWLLASGVLCAVAPSYFGATGAQRTAWFIAGAMLGMTGGLGLVIELTTDGERGELSDLGVGGFLLVIALGFGLAAQRWEPRSPFEGLLKVGTFMFVLFAAMGFTKGAETAWRRRTPREKPLTRGQAVGALLVAAIGFATALVNLYGAFHSAGGGANP